MASRILRDGRVYWQSPDWPRPKPERRIRQEMVELGVDLEQTPSAEYAIPVVPSDYEQQVRARALTVGGFWTDAVHKVTYRIVHYADPRDGWCLLSQMTKFYKTTYKTIFELCRMGLIDCVLETGSPTKRYRPRDSGKIHLILERRRSVALPDRLKKRRVQRL